MTNPERFIPLMEVHKDPVRVVLGYPNNTSHTAALSLT